MRLYLDDLARVDALVRSIAERNVTLAVDDYRLDAVVELGELPMTSPRRLYWISLAPDLSVHLSERGAAILATGDEPLLRGVVEQIADVLRSCRRPAHRLFAWSSVPAFLAAVVLGGLGLAGLGGWPLLLPQLVCLTWGFFALRAWFGRGAAIFTVQRTQRPSFWSRKRDDLALLVIGALTGAVVTTLLGQLSD